MSRASAKARVLEALKSGCTPADLAESLADLPLTRLVEALLAALSRPEEDIRLRAAQALGRVALDISPRGEEPEPVREILRRLFWRLNDDSGGIGWGASLAAAEIMARRAEVLGQIDLAAEFGPPLVSLLAPRNAEVQHPALRREIEAAVLRLRPVLDRSCPQAAAKAKEWLTF